MSITILLTCVFGITPFFPGEERSARVLISRARFELIREEEGDDGKKRLCRERFGSRADLAWFERIASLEETAGSLAGHLITQEREDVL